MKSMMGFGFFMLFLGGMAFAMLKGLKVSEQEKPSINLAETSWRPVSVGDDSLPEDSGMSLTFEMEGNLSGHGGCNAFFGTMKQTDSGIEIGGLGTTRMSCEESVMSRELAFLDALQKASKFHADADGMRLLNDEGVVLAVFVAGIP